MLKFEYAVAKSKNQRRVRHLLSISAWYLVTDLIGIFNPDSRISVSKFSGSKWFLVFEDLYSREGSLQANKTSKKH